MHQEIEDLLQSYEDDGCVFKSKSPGWIIVLKKTENTETNEEIVRAKYVDAKEFWRYIANELYVVDIVNKFIPGLKLESIYGSCGYAGDPIKDYVVGEVAHCKRFGLGDHPYGIGYYLRYEAAYHAKMARLFMVLEWDKSKDLYKDVNIMDYVHDLSYTRYDYYGIKSEEVEHNGPGNYTKTFYHPKEPNDDSEQEESGVEYYIDDALDGIVELYHKEVDGVRQLEFRGEWNNDAPVGTHIYWFDDGNISRMMTHINGKIDEFTRYHKNGTIEDHCKYIDGQRDGLEEGWYSDGTQASQGNYVRGIKTGMFTAWHYGGQKSHEITYVDGRIHGIESSWNPYGSKLSMTIWDNGIIKSNIMYDTDDEEGHEATEEESRWLSCTVGEPVEEAIE
jgi:antitoxin component YwqK of YwqJK toxin-antitoxin module